MFVSRLQTEGTDNNRELISLLKSRKGHTYVNEGNKSTEQIKFEDCLNIPKEVNVN